MFGHDFVVGDKFLAGVKSLQKCGVMKDTCYNVKVTRRLKDVFTRPPGTHLQTPTPRFLSLFMTESSGDRPNGMRDPPVYRTALLPQYLQLAISHGQQSRATLPMEPRVIPCSALARAAYAEQDGS